MLVLSDLDLHLLVHVPKQLFRVIDGVSLEEAGIVLDQDLLCAVEETFLIIILS